VVLVSAQKPTEVSMLKCYDSVTGSSANREKLPKIALAVGIPPISGSLELAKVHMNATILGGSPERRANSRLAAGAGWI